MRDLLLDAFRGFNVLEMANSDLCEHPFFDHAEYYDMKLKYSDTIFPCFAFIAGMSPGRVRGSRNIMLVGLGVASNAIPELITGNKVRAMGVLQRHGLSSMLLYNVAPVVFVKLACDNSFVYPLMMTALWMTLSYLCTDNIKSPFKSRSKTAQFKIDLFFFKDRLHHTGFEPEGLLGVLMTSVTIWSGLWFTKSNLSDTNTLIAGLLCIGAGKAISMLFPSHVPISKQLWTPSFTLSTNGISMLKYLGLKVMFPYFPRILSQSLVCVGRHSLKMYFAIEMIIILWRYRWYKKDGHKKNLWGICTNFLTQYIPKWTSDFVLSGITTGAILSIASGL